MSRRVPLCLVVAVVLVAFSGCGRSFLKFEERAAWRHEAEVQCLKTGVVKESSALVRISPITGPGMCGADFPLKVAALGDGTALGFADELRPPGAIGDFAPRSQPRFPGAPSPYAPSSASYPAPSYAPPPDSYPARTYGPAAGGAPLSILPPGGDIDVEDLQAPSQQPMRSAPVTSIPASVPQYSPVPLGPPRGPQVTGTIGPVEVKPAATLACPIVSALDQWIAGSVQPSALRWFGQPVVEIKQISAYSCRGMNGQAGAPISEHAFGNALDIAAFKLADGRNVVVQKAWNGSPEEQGFLHDVQGGACQQFTTVLAPGSNSFHYNHIHVDLMRRASRRQICQPAAIPGELAAARAAGKNSTYAKRGDPGFTGSIGKKQAKALVPAFGRYQDEEILDEDIKDGGPMDLLDD
jgi:hypothetical protein